MAWNDTCRLCALSVGRCISVFNDDGVKINLEHKLRVCSPVVVRQNDKLPTTVCLSCLSALDQTYDFYQKVKSAQLTLKALEQERTKKRRLSDTNEETNLKRINFGSTTISNLLKSFTSAELEAGTDNIEPTPPHKPLVGEVSPVASPQVALPSGKTSPAAGTPTKVHPVKKSSVASNVLQRPSPPTSGSVRLKAEPPSPSRHNISPSSSLQTELGSDIFKTCEYCNRKFLPENYPQHVALHKGGIVFVCDQCNKSFFTEPAYKRHLARHQHQPN